MSDVWPVPSLLQLVAREFVGREHELADPTCVPAELVEIQAAYTATHCPRCWRAARALPLDPRWPQCRFGHTGVGTLDPASRGHLACLEYAHRKGAVWHPWTIWGAAQGGYLACLEYAHRNGAPWHPYTTWAAAYGGHLACLEYAHRNGAPWDPWTTRAAKDPECRAYCRAHDPALAAHCGCLRVV